MVEEETGETGEELPLEGVGQSLRRAREEQGLTLEQVAQRTRISLRYLDMMEQGQFSELPARTYAFGFTRTYAREVGLDDQKLINALRSEFAEGGDRRSAYTPAFEPGDPAKVPPAGVIWAAAIAALLLAVGSYAFYASHSAPGADPAPLVAEKQPSPTGAAVAAGASDTERAGAPVLPPDQVVFTALEEGVWVSFYEAGGRRLEQKLMSEGERFVVPSEARDPRIWTGRPDAFAITIGGQRVPKLSEEEVVIRDVAITAEALRTRGQPGEASPAAMIEANSAPAMVIG